MRIEEEHIPCRIIGMGNTGCTVVDGLAEAGFKTECCVMIAGGLWDRRESRCPVKIDLLDRKSTRGFDCSNDPAWCHEAAMASLDIIRNSLEGSKLNIIVAGMGGGIGTYIGPIIAGISRQMGALTMAVISRPFPFEGKRRKERASTGIEQMSKAADMTILIPYDRLWEILTPSISLLDAFNAASKMLDCTVRALYDWLTYRSDSIDNDFETKKRYLQNAGPVYVGFGSGNGVIAAMEKAISSPLLRDVNLQKAEKIFGIVNAVRDTTPFEINEALVLLRDTIGNEDTLIVHDLSLDGEVGVFLIATANS